MKEALFRAVLAIPCATFAGGFFGAVFVVLPAFFCRDYIKRFTPVSDDVTMLDGKVVSYALSKIEISILGLILGGLAGIVLSSTLSVHAA